MMLLLLHSICVACIAMSHSVDYTSAHIFIESMSTVSCVAGFGRGCTPTLSVRLPKDEQKQT
jgi:hypothetical protein